MDLNNNNVIKKPSTPAGLDKKDIIQNLLSGGCAVCNYMDDVVFDFFAKWQYALTNDENVQKEHAVERGFCPVHTWQLSTICSSRGLSVGYPKLLERIADELTKLIDNAPNISDEIAELIKDSKSCRICRLLFDTENMYMRGLAALLEQEEVRAIYARSHGVCLRHLSMLVSYTTSGEVEEFLLSEKVKALRKTAEDMRCYVLKHDALERHLINRDEKYAYLRALVHVAGARNVCAPHIMRI